MKKPKAISDSDRTQARELLVQADMRPTLVRLEVVGMFLANPGRHFRVDQLYATINAGAKSMFALSTLYRSLADLSSNGLVTKRVLDRSSAVYELADIEHDHIVVKNRGEIIEIEESDLRGVVAEILRTKKLKDSDFNIVVYAEPRG